MFETPLLIILNNDSWQKTLFSLSHVMIIFLILLNKKHRQTFDLFGELDPVWVGKGARLLVNVVNVQDFTHKLDDRLGFVKSCGRHWKNTGQTASFDESVTQVDKNWMTGSFVFIQCYFIFCDFWRFLRAQCLPSILSIIFHIAGRTDWWKPNQTSLPPPSGWS